MTDDITAPFFSLHVPASVSIRNNQTNEVFHFDVTVLDICIYKISFVFIHKSFALKLSKMIQAEASLSALINISYSSNNYSFELDILDHAVEITPDKQFEIKMVGKLVNHLNDNSIDEELFFSNYDLPVDQIASFCLCGYNEALDIMTSLSFSNMFTGFMNNRIDCELFESEILNKLDEAQQKKVLSVYHKDYRHNEYRMFSDASWQDRATFLQIIRELD